MDGSFEKCKKKVFNAKREGGRERERGSIIEILAIMQFECAMYLKIIMIFFSSLYYQVGKMIDFEVQSPFFFYIFLSQIDIKCKSLVISCDKYDLTILILEITF